MKTISKIMCKSYALVALVMGLFVATACSSDDNMLSNDSQSPTNENVMVMHLTGDCPSYDEDGTRASTITWADKDVISLVFINADSTFVGGKAVYSASTNTWNVSYYGQLSTGQTYSCRAYYFPGGTYEDNQTVNLTPHSGIYLTTEGTYIIEDGELFVSANLKPALARVRFQGTPGETIGVQGLRYYCKFDLKELTYYFYTNSYFEVTIKSNGYSDYCYGYLPDNELLLTDFKYVYSKTFDSSKFVAGKSGYIVVPTQEVNKGWTETKYIPSNAVDMGLSVYWSSMNVGATDSLDYGTWTSWGDPNGTYTSGSISYNSSIYYIAGNASYDLATNKWGEGWRTPTKEQWDELFNSSNCTWSRYSKTINGTTRYYMQVTSLKTGNSIYLPYYNYVSYSGTSTSSSSSGYYWTATCHSSASSEAYYVNLTTYCYYSSLYKCYRMQIRPVYVSE